MMKNIKYILCAFAFVTLITACMGQVKPIGQAPLNLLKFDFDTKIKDLYPDKYKSEKWDDYYDIPVGENTRVVQRDTTFINEFSQDQKAVGIEYRQMSSSSKDELALADKQAFNSISIATSIEGKIKAIGAQASEITNEETKNFIESLTKKYGNYKKLEGDFMSKFTIYEWEAGDRIFRYATVYTDEQNTMKLEIDKDKGTIKEGERNPHHNGYFFVINKEFVKDLATLQTGIFVYIK